MLLFFLEEASIAREKKSTALAKSPFLNAAFPDAFSSSSSSSMMMMMMLFDDEKESRFFLSKKEGSRDNWSRQHSPWWDARLTPQIREEGVVPFFSIIIHY